MQINYIFDSSVKQAPSNFASILNQAAQFLDQTFINPITVNIQVGWDEIGGNPLPSDVIGEGGPANGDLFKYSQVRAALAANVSSEADALAVANMPNTDPTGNSSIYVASAEEKALGLVSANGSAVDGQVGFQGNVGLGDVLHEITHAMGRIADLGQSDVSGEFSVLDLFRYVTNGVLSPRSVFDSYFSFDGGHTHVNTFANSSDLGDWAGLTADAFNAFGGPNDPVTTGDLEEMDVLGFALANPAISGQSLVLTNIPETVLGAPGDTIIGSSGTAVINALGGHQTVNGGSGATTVFAAAGDSITAGSGATYVDGSSGGATIAAGSAGGSDTIIGSAAPIGGAGADTLFGGAATVLVQGLGKGDVVNFSGQTGTAAINATAGLVSVTLGAAFAVVYGGIGDTIAMGTTGQLATGFTGGTKMVAGAAGTDSMIGSVARVSGAGPDTLVGGAASVIVQGLGQGDIVLFGSETGAAAINATNGNDAITLGGGPGSVFGGIGDTVSFGSGNQYADGLTGGTNFVVGTAGSDTIIGSAFRSGATGVDTLTGGAAAVLVEGLGAGDIVNFANQSGSAAINATAGNNAVTLGSGAATVYGGVGGSIVLGSGAQLAAALTGGETVAVGTAGGNDTIVGSVARAGSTGVDTLTGGAAVADVAGVGAGDIVNFAGQTGTAAINALAGSNTVTLGSGAATVFGGAGDTITLGSGNQYVDASSGAGALIKLGLAGTDNIAGSMVAGSGATIKGGAAALIYNAGTGNDLVDLTGAAESAVVNGLAADTGAINDTIIAGNGGSAVFGGKGDRIGVGANASGTDQFFHSTTIAGASVGFGTNGTAANSSSANVTVTGFAETGGNATDFLFYQGETGATTTSIVTGSTQTGSGGSVSTMLTLPDGTVMTLAGVAKADFNAGFFKA